MTTPSGLNLLSSLAVPETRRRVKEKIRTPFVYQIARAPSTAKNARRPNQYFWSQNETNALINFLVRPNIFIEGNRGVPWRRIPSNSILMRRMVQGSSSKGAKQLVRKLKRLLSGENPPLRLVVDEHGRKRYNRV